MSKNNREEKVIKEIIRCYCHQEKSAILQNMFDQCNQSALAELVQRFRLGPFINHAISTGHIPLQVPESMRTAWKNEARAIGMQNALFEKEALQLFNTLEQDCDYILLKGFSLMNDLYGTTLTRPVGDIDILVRKQQYPAVKNILTALDYMPYTEEEFAGLEEQRIKVGEEDLNEQHWMKRSGAMEIHLDVHWGINTFLEGAIFRDMYPVDRYPWWDRLEECNLAGNTCTCLNREMQFIHLVHHFALHHTFRGLKWFLDICLYVHQHGSEMDWAELRKVLGDANNLKMVGIILRLVQDVIKEMPAGVPAWQEFWSSPELPGDFQVFQDRLMGSSSHIRSSWALICMPASIRDRLRVSMFLLFNPEAVPKWRILGFQPRFKILQPFYLLAWALRERHRSI